MVERSLRAGLTVLPRTQPLYSTSRARCWLPIAPAVPRVAGLSIRQDCVVMGQIHTPQTTRCVSYHQWTLFSWVN